MAGSRRTAGAERKSRVSVVLSCSVCGARNYKRTKARKDGSAALELKKFCKVCEQHTLHIESK